ncbi:MAG: hypothetical protein JST54_35435 [Deltaproteobacteria bacterium]|nr:hypothetical protein [Deltaproteobacteria bacterium]
MNGNPNTPNFCDGVPALPQCAACLQNACGVQNPSDPMSCSPTGTGGTSGSGSTSGSTGSTGPSCANPSTINDCGTCGTQSDCVTCASTVDAAGVQPYNDLLDCVYCTACYTSCDGANAGCLSAPATFDSCDSSSTNTSACQACQTCSLGGTCAGQLAACQGQSQCTDLAQNLPSVCGALPI